MNISLTPELTRLIQSKIASGQYASASAVVQDALKRMADDDRGRGKTSTAINEKIAAGMASSRAGRLIDSETVGRLLRTRARQSPKRRRSR